MGLNLLLPSQLFGAREKAFSKELASLEVHWSLHAKLSLRPIVFCSSSWSSLLLTPDLLRAPVEELTWALLAQRWLASTESSLAKHRGSGTFLIYTLSRIAFFLVQMLVTLLMNYLKKDCRSKILRAHSWCEEGQNQWWWMENNSVW